MKIHVYGLELLRTLEDEGRPMTAKELSDETGQKYCSINYRMNKLAESGYINSFLEEGDASELKRPLRRFYQLTQRGKFRLNSL
jgi:DNA-binding PadR family transcriptional regulator